MHFAGRSTSSANGFTLLELVIVITLMGMVMLFTLPNFESGTSFNSADQFSRWLIMNVIELKERSVRDQKTYAMVFNMEEGTVYKTEETLITDLDNPKQKPTQNKYSLPDGVRILDIEYPKKGKINFGEVKVRFYSKGYSDKALLHLSDADNRQITYRIEPFLTSVKRYDHYADFED